MPSSPPGVGWGFGVYEDPVEGGKDEGREEEGMVEVGGEVEVEKVVRGLRVDGNGRAVVDFAGASRGGGGE